jgi:hypothetical protein
MSLKEQTASAEEEEQAVFGIAESWQMLKKCNDVRLYVKKRVKFFVGEQLKESRRRRRIGQQELERRQDHPSEAE